MSSSSKSPSKKPAKIKPRLHMRVKTAKGRKISSTRWLERQLNDPYVEAARKAGYRARAAFKLLEIDDRFRFLRRGGRVIDLGSAPGSWTQIAIARTQAPAHGRVFAIDIAPMQPLAGCAFLQLDFSADDAQAQLAPLLAGVGGQVDVVLSDMAASVTGHRSTDHLRTLYLAELASDFAFQHLAPRGVFCVKMFQGGTERELLLWLKKNFDSVIHMKPKASRKESAELYVIARGFRG